MTSSFYDTDEAVAQYLLFHYGTPEQICPLLPEARGACGFPARCVTEPLQRLSIARTRRALDLGCAVGRGSFELARHFEEVVGIDFSFLLIEAALAMQERGSADIRAPREGASCDEFHVEVPPTLPRDRVRFEQGDACRLRDDLGVFDLVLLANLIDRLPDPVRCLARLPGLVEKDGWLIITSPYTWLEEYTPRKLWLSHDRDGTLAALREILMPDFSLHTTLDLPFVIRDHRRKYQWSVAEVSVWQRR